MGDPVADFLAREQNMLAELDGDAPPVQGMLTFVSLSFDLVFLVNLFNNRSHERR